MNRNLLSITPSSRGRACRTWLRAFVASTLAVACAGGRVDGEAQQLTDVVFVAVLPGSATLPIGDSVAMSTVVIDGRGDTLRGPVLKWQSANPAIATISAAGMVRAVAPGLAGITAESGGRTGSARVIVTPGGPPRQNVSTAGAPQATKSSPPPAAQPPAAVQSVAAQPERVPSNEAAVARRGAGAAHPNEPAGFRPLTNRAFLTTASRDDDRGDKECRGGSECWDGVEYRYKSFAIIEDRSAPFSCCTIARMNYPAGHRSGTAPATVQTLVFRPPVKQLYVEIWARLSPNWFGNQSGTNKMLFLGASSGNNQFFLSAEGRGNGPLEPQIRLQGIGDPRARVRPNEAPGTVLTRGAWHRWEFVLTCNSGLNASDGTIDFWLDGRHVTSVRNVNWTQTKHPGRACDFPIFHWSPTYGGGGAPPPDHQYLDFDHVYVSGK